MSVEYLWFVSAFALILTAASLVVFTHRGQALVLSGMRRCGRLLGVGEFGLLRYLGDEDGTLELPSSQRAALAESYIAAAEAQTLISARATVWILISGLVFTAIVGIVITGLLPVYVVSGEWSYELYSRVVQWSIALNVAGGLAMGAGLVWWLVVRTFRLNRTRGCVAARDLVVAAQGPGLDPEMQAEVATGAYPRLEGLLADVA